jgi:hypothetical protein
MKAAPVQQLLSMETRPSLCHLARSVSAFPTSRWLVTATCAALRRRVAWRPSTTALDRKSGGAQWRDLRSSGLFLGTSFVGAKRSGETCGFFFPVFTPPLERPNNKTPATIDQVVSKVRNSHRVVRGVISASARRLQCWQLWINDTS